MQNQFNGHVGIVTGAHGNRIWPCRTLSFAGSQKFYWMISRTIGDSCFKKFVIWWYLWSLCRWCCGSWVYKFVMVKQAGWKFGKRTIAVSHAGVYFVRRFFFLSSWTISTVMMWIGAAVFSWPSMPYQWTSQKRHSSTHVFGNMTPAHKDCRLIVCKSCDEMLAQNLVIELSRLHKSLLLLLPTNFNWKHLNDMTIKIPGQISLSASLLEIHDIGKCCIMCLLLTRFKHLTDKPWL